MTRIRHAILLFIILLVGNDCFAQNIYQERYRNLDDGEHSGLFNNKKYKLIKLDGYLVEYVTFFESGDKREHIRFKNGHYNGLQEVFYNKSNLHFYVQMDTLIWSDDTLYYSSENNQIKEHFHYHRDSFPYHYIDKKYFSQDLLFIFGKQNCILTTYFKNGLIKSKGLLINNEKYGEWNFYKDNGALSKTKFFEKK